MYMNIQDRGKTKRGLAEHGRLGTRDAHSCNSFCSSYFFSILFFIFSVCIKFKLFKTLRLYEIVREEYSQLRSHRQEIIICI